MTIQVGMTGTRQGMTHEQAARFNILLRVLLSQHPSPATPLVLRHGDCIGADEQAATMARAQGFKIIGHPPTNPHHRAFFPSDETLDPADYLVRNKAIVNASAIMFAFPKLFVEERRSGTWHAIRFTKALRNKPLTIIWPDGSFEGMNYAAK